MNSRQKHLKTLQTGDGKRGNFNENIGTQTPAVHISGKVPEKFEITERSLPVIPTNVLSLNHKSSPLTAYPSTQHTMVHYVIVRSAGTLPRVVCPRSQWRDVLLQEVYNGDEHGARTDPSRHPASIDNEMRLSVSSQ